MKFYTTARSSKDYYKNFFISNCKEKNVLECGCGIGLHSIYLANHIAGKVTGIDISAAAIESAKNQAKVQNVGNVAFLVMNAEALDFDDNSFDVVCGTGILHHLDIENAFREITRILCAGGKAIFVEPMGYNPVINIYRSLTPHLRVKGEHPLREKDLKLISRFFKRADFKFFHLFSLLTAPFRNTAIFSFLLSLLDYLDRKLAALLPFLRIFFWQVVIVLEDPDKA